MPSRKGRPNKRPAKTRIMLRLGEDTLSRIAAHQAANQLPSRTAAVEDLAKRGNTMNCTSIDINRLAKDQGGLPLYVASIGAGDQRITLWILPNGEEIIETNGEPVGASDDGFAEMRAEIMS